MKLFNQITLFSILLCFFLFQKASAQTVSYSQTFTNGSSSPNQCTAWSNFVNSISASSGYVKMTISGTYDATGISCTDKTIIADFITAIKNLGGTTYISGTTSGHVWSVCNRYSGEIWIDPPSLCNGSNCPNPGYLIRPCIGNSNWGGVNTATCGGPNQVMTLTFEKPTKPNDAGISAINRTLCVPDMSVTYNNHGTNALDSAKINWSVNGALQTQIRYTTAIGQGGKPVDVPLKPNFNFVDGVTYTVKSWTSLPNNSTDSVPDNDTSTVTFKFYGPAGTPSTTPSTKCGPGKAPLVCTTPFQTDSVLWFDAATGGNQIGSGKNTLSPPLVLGVNTFYAQAFKIGGASTLDNGITRGNSYWSGMAYTLGFVDITPVTGMLLDSFTIKMLNVTPTVFEVFMKTGTGKGYETNSGAWTQILKSYTARVITATSGGNAWAYIKLPSIMLNGGTTYGFHIAAASNPFLMYYSSGGILATNADAKMQTTAQGYGTGPFVAGGYTYDYYGMTMQMHYRNAICPSARVAAVITVKPSPNGAGFTKGTPFQTMQPNTTGTLSSPDIVAKGDQLTYELTPPKGYNTSDYGNTWIAGYPIVKSKTGIAIDPKYWSWAPPSGGTPGKLTFSPDKDIVDSLYIISLQIRDLGPYYCDSTIFRNIFVAPRPVPDFSFNSPVCDGDAVLFNDKSTISSGGLSYKWEFDTGNPADTATINTTVFTFPTFGTYNVKLTVTSTPYGYVESITIPVVVTEIPKIGFKVVNACEKVAVKFNNTTTIGSGTITYVWDFGDPTTALDKSTLEHPTYLYPSPGGYKVTLRATSSGCTSELTKNANQFPTPVAKFTYPTLICDKSDVQFTNGSTIKMGNMGYTWNFGDGGISNFANPVHEFANTTTRQVKMKVVSEFGCTDSLTKTISLVESPTADFSWGPACNLSNTNFSFTGTKPTGALTSFNWDFAGEGSTTLENPSKLFSVVGKKMVTLTLLSNNGCQDVITKEVDVKLQSKADFTIDDVCEDNDAVFTNNSAVSMGNLLYNWKFGDTYTSTIHSPRHLYSIGGVSKTFNVTLVAIVPGGCSDSITKPVSVNAKPISNFTFTTSGRRVTFTPNQAGNTSYTWRFGDGGNSTVINPVYDYTAFASGKYQACLAVINAANCFSETCNEVNITGGIESIVKLTGVKVYPNPNHGSFTVTVDDPKSDIAVAVYNLLGEIVKTIETNPLKSTYSIDLNVANGVYMVKVTNGGLTSTQKVTISK